MNDMTYNTVAGFLDALAARTPTPGGGGAAGVGGALAAAMARMVAAYSTSARSTPEVARAVQAWSQRLEKADHLMRQLALEDAAAYEALTSAGKALRAAEQAAGGAGVPTDTAHAHRAALGVAIGVPMEMLATLAALLHSLDESKSLASRYLLSDLGVAAALAFGAARAARYSVLVNVRELPDAGERERLLAETAAAMDRCERARSAVERFVEGELAVS